MNTSADVKLDPTVGACLPPSQLLLFLEVLRRPLESTQHFHGGVMAANVDLEDNTVLRTADIVYSSCAIERAILNSALTQARPLDARSWVDLSSVSY